MSRITFVSPYRDLSLLVRSVVDEMGIDVDILGFSAFVVYPMGLVTKEQFSIATSITGGKLSDINQAFHDGYRTPDIYTEGTTNVTTVEMDFRRIGYDCDCISG